jgi:hypothetical protein
MTADDRPLWLLPGYESEQERQAHRVCDVCAGTGEQVTGYTFGVVIRPCPTCTEVVA